ncbi:MAG: FAD-dependent oxidoreductase [Candidatus Omnitrophota bacterium]
MKKKIIIIGGGFAGLSAMRRLGTLRRLWQDRFEVLLIDPKADFEFLPMLPDVVGGKVSPGSLRFPLDPACRRAGCKFLKEKATRVDVLNRNVHCAERIIEYEYLLMASGAKTDFHGDQELEKTCFKLNSVDDAVGIRNEVISRVSSGRKVNILIAGGGYTGVELSASIAVFLKKGGIRGRVIVTEPASDILLASPVWVRDLCRKELESMDVEILTGESLKMFRDGTAFLGSRGKVDNAFCVWTAGVRTGRVMDNVPGKKYRTRLGVDEFLNPVECARGENVFAAGDAAAFSPGASERPLRMAVMFAMGQGKRAAENIVGSIEGKPLIPYRAEDLGYVIPLSKGKAPGIVLGKEIHPRIGYLLHYFMCLYRAPFMGKLRIAKDIIFKRRGKWIEKTH